MRGLLLHRPLRRRAPSSPPSRIRVGRQRARGLSALRRDVRSHRAGKEPAELVRAAGAASDEPVYRDPPPLSTALVEATVGRALVLTRGREGSRGLVPAQEIGG